MATAADYATSPGFSGARSPDTASPIYPERAIRPLPKNRLKSKLSPQQVSSLVFPPEPPPISPTLAFTGQEAPGGAQVQGRVTNGDASYGHNHAHVRGEAAVHNHCTCGEEGDSGDEVEFDHPEYRYAPPPTTNGTSEAGKDKVLDNVQRRLMEASRLSNKPPPPGSNSSSADGYESFENTSNKKKRKIPLPGASSMHQSQLSAGMASMGISGGSMDGTRDDVHGGAAGATVAVQQPTTSSAAMGGAGTGISGAGRGRYGRQTGRGSDHGIRRPLGSSNMNAVNGYGSRLPPRHAAPDSGIENTGGIISQAIKSAAEQGPLTPQKGQENGSLLPSASSQAPGTASERTQFTFTMESESASKMVDQQANAAAMNTPTPSARNANGQPVLPGRGMPSQASRAQPQQHYADPNTAPHPQQQQPPRPKPRRRPSKEFAIAAKQRMLSQRYNNIHHRPSKDSMWICEFCEYESIYGEPPRALIRQYEIKDRAERKKAAEKMRLLEKAKAKGRKGRKGKKGGGGNNNNATAAPAPVNSGGGGHAYDPGLPMHGQGHGHPHGQGEDEFYDDDYDADEYDPIGPDDDDLDYGDSAHPDDEITYDDKYYSLQRQQQQMERAAAHHHPPPLPPPPALGPPRPSEAVVDPAAATGGDAGGRKRAG